MIGLQNKNNSDKENYKFLSLNGIPVSQFVINCTDYPQGMVYRGCEELRDVVKETSGVELDIKCGFDDSIKNRIIVVEEGNDKNSYSVDVLPDGNIKFSGGHGYSLNAALHKFANYVRTVNNVELKVGNILKGKYDEKTENTDGYHLVFSDEFDGDDFDKVWTKNEWEDLNCKYHPDAKSAEVKDGILHIQSAPIKMSDGSDGYNGAEIFRNDMTFACGYFEIRAKMPRGNGSQTAFWMKGSRTENPQKPYTGEIDVYETFGEDLKLISCFHSWWKKGFTIEGLECTEKQIEDGHIQHLTYNSPDLNGGMHYDIPHKDGEVSAADGWHTYGCEWTTEFIKYYCDGYNYATVDISKVATDPETGKTVSPYEIFRNGTQVQFYFTHAIIKHKLVKPLEADSEIPSNFYVDYLHLYQKPKMGKFTKLFRS